MVIHHLHENKTNVFTRPIKYSIFINILSLILDYFQNIRQINSIFMIIFKNQNQITLA